MNHEQEAKRIIEQAKTRFDGKMTAQSIDAHYDDECVKVEIRGSYSDALETIYLAANILGQSPTDCTIETMDQWRETVIVATWFHGID